MTLDEITRLRDENLASLISRRKLQLLVDLDNTLIHTARLGKLTDEDQQYLKDTQTRLGRSGDAFIHDMMDRVYVLKIRPGAIAFLKELSLFFDISIYTLAKRSYATRVANILDPNKYIFKDVICREDCTSPGLKGLDVVLSHERVVLIVDDMRGVWRYNTANLVQIGGYKFFKSKVKESSVEKLIESELSSCCTMDKELSRVLATLELIYSLFYGEGEGEGDYENRDVREILKGIIKEDDKGLKEGDKSMVMVSESEVKPCERK